MTSTTRVSTRDRIASCAAWIRKRPWLPALGLAAVAFIGVLLATRQGPSLGNDSVDYLVAARNLLSGNGYVDFEGQAMTIFPPAYPVAILTGDFLGLDAELSARLVNATAYALVVVLAFVLLRRHVRSLVLVFAGLLLVTFSPALLRASDYVKSEPLFCVFVLGFVLILEDIVRKPERRSSLVLAAAVLTWCAFLTRYAGVWLAVAGVITLVVAAPLSTSRRAALKRALVFGMLCAVGPLAWLVRNAASRSGEVLGLRVPSDLGPIDLVDRLLSSIGYWFLPEPVPHLSGPTSRALALTLGVGVIVVIAAVAAMTYHHRARAAHRALLPLVLLVVTYLGFVLVSNLRTGSSINSRILTPIVVPVIVLMAWLGEFAVDRLRATNRTRAGTLVVAAAALVIVTEMFLFANLVNIHGRAARGYGTAASRRSELARVVRDVDPEATIFSNDPWAVSYWSDREPVRLAPKLLEPGMSHRPVAVQDLAQAASCSGGALLVWFFDAPEPRNEHGNEISKEPPPPYVAKGSATPAVRLRRVVGVEDGTLYRIEANGKDHNCSRASVSSVEN